MTGTIDTEATAASAGGRPTAGAKLRAAREAAGLSVDAVAQQLKLAPRQVKALEDDDWQRLPGRTFVRGFARNYARFVRLDPDAVLALLPAPETAPALERPALAASPRPMGEIPVERVAKPSALRWIVPLLVVAALALAAYQFVRAPTQFLARFDIPGLRGERSSAPAVPVTANPLADAPATAAPAAGTGSTTTTLANPIGTQPDAGASTTSATLPVTPSSDATTTPASVPASAAETSAVAPAPGTAGATMPANAAAAAPATAAEAPLVLTFKGTSWVEVKDAHGRVVVQMTGGAGMTQTVSVVPPLELALGNAPQVEVTFRGQLLDLSPYTRGNVARVALK